jgi:hypothetical protein
MGKTIVPSVLEADVKKARTNVKLAAGATLPTSKLWGSTVNSVLNPFVDGSELPVSINALERTCTSGRLGFGSFVDCPRNSRGDRKGSYEKYPFQTRRE